MAIIDTTLLWAVLGALIITLLLATIGLIGRYLRGRLLHFEPSPIVVLRQSTPEASIVDNHGRRQRNEDDAWLLDSWSDGGLPARFRRPDW
jgi:hypothetical protein